MSSQEILEEDPGFYFMNQNRMATFAEALKRRKLSQATRKTISFPDRPLNDSDVSLTETEVVAQWCHDNLRQQVRPFKQKQLWLHGPHDVGKTSFVIELAKHLRVFHPPSEDFWCDWEDGVHDVIVYDEFIGQQKMTFMNQLVQGSHMQLKRKGLPGIMKKINIAVIVLSNLCIKECYWKLENDHKDITMTLRTRFLEAKWSKLRIVNMSSE